MTWLLDVNALVALGFKLHEHHHRMNLWVRGLDHSDTLATTPLTELGFVRILNQVPGYKVPVITAKQLLEKLKATPIRSFEFIDDDHGVRELPAWVNMAKQTTDGHLFALAQAHGAELVTFDGGIPGAALIP